MSEERRGFLAGLGAYVLWGVFPLYFPLLDPASSTEVLGHRIVWSLLVVLALVAVRRRWASLRAVLRDRRRMLLLVAAAGLITVNWGTFIWATTHDHVVDVSLGYFVNPLVLIAFGVLLLGERLRPWQWVGLGFAVVAVVELTVDAGTVPWVALALASSFGTYGLVKKQVGVGAVEGLTVETAVLTPVALGYVVWLQAAGSGTGTSEGVAHAALLVGTGVITVLPLLLFAAAASRVTLTVLGILQYVAPVMQLLLGVVVFDEPMSTGRWIGFGLVWLALAIITTESLLHGRRRVRRERRERLEAVAASTVC